ncbi:protein phosphatase [Salix suchowensis]|nr:protein phosphatase [Salix suchowensis]
MPYTYFSRLRSAVRRSGIGQEGVLQEFKSRIEQGKFRFCNYRLFHPLCIASLTDLQLLLSPDAVIASSSDSILVNRRRKISVVGALPRTFSVPSVSGPSFQGCGYHIDRALCDNYQISVSGKAVFSECILENLTSRGGDLPLPANNHSISLGSSSQSFRKYRMILKNREQPTSSPFYGYCINNAAKRWCNFSPYMESGLREFHCSSHPCFAAGTAHDVTYENSTREEQLEGCASSEQYKYFNWKNTQATLRIMLPAHPDKEETGGEDAHFICADEQAVGVADGVGGWADHGVDSGQYSRELMSNSVAAIQEEPKGSIDPARVLEKAYSSTKAKGSSTACIIALTDQGLHAINLGDSGFVVVRGGSTIFRSPVQQHGFNFTYQLEDGNSGALPSSGQVFTIPVAPGDFIVAGTDGLFDNLYNTEITAIVVHAMRAGLEPQAAAQKIAALARQRAEDKDRQTPFSTSAQNAGFRYYGGKLDDITVVVSYITSLDDYHGFVFEQRSSN